MKKAALLFIAASIIVSGFGSCISKKRFLDARRRADVDDREIMALNHRVSSMNDTINSLNGNLSDLNGRISALGLENENKQSQLNMTREQIAAQRRRMQQLQALLDQQQQNAEALRKKIADALTGFNSSELTVTMKNGRVYISMQESLLFPSGSAVVNPKGKEALAKVSSVLNGNPDINVDVEGHTDSVAIHNKIYADNWALSVARATSIARVMIDDYGVTPNRLIASGRSHYDPVATNETPVGRALNRRTEIILEPKLDELMELMNGNGNASGMK